MLLDTLEHEGPFARLMRFHQNCEEASIVRSSEQINNFFAEQKRISDSATKQSLSALNELFCKQTSTHASAEHNAVWRCLPGAFSFIRLSVLTGSVKLKRHLPRRLSPPEISFGGMH